MSIAWSFVHWTGQKGGELLYYVFKDKYMHVYYIYVLDIVYGIPTLSLGH